MATIEGQNEPALVCAARDGDKKALQELLVRNWSWLRGLVYSIVADADEIDDVLQDICVRVIEKVSSVRQPERFRPWLAVLARRQALRHRQQRARRAELSPSDSGIGASPVLLGETPLVTENAERAEQCEQILQALKLLPEKYREVFMLQYSSDLTYRQIAEILDIPVTTVQIRLVRARAMIRDQVGGKDTLKGSKFPRAKP
ncbi:MAG: RNA polymerase sigma factor [Planctomycetota bacterium]|jgi:RNA polymerase sigma-70 factor (ECF subfamily)